MFEWIRNWMRAEPAPGADLDTLLRDRRRLEELAVSYREFGFDVLVPDCRNRIAALDRELREARAGRHRPGRETLTAKEE